MDRIELHGMSFQGRHGVSDRERASPQEFRVDLEVECDVATAGHSDRLDDTIDYTKLRAIARDVIEGPSARLIERLAAQIAERALQMPGVASIDVRVAKRPASMRPIDSAAVHIKRTRG